MGIPAGPAKFPTTLWSCVLAAQQPTPDARVALSTLLGRYWFPLYAYVRRRGHSPDEAQDLTQGFFTRLVEKNDLAAADRSRGRFRSWLLASLSHYLSNEWDRARAEKRGGGAQAISIDAEDAEGRYRVDPSHTLTPEKLFERQWTLTTLQRVLDTLGLDYAGSGKAALFGALKSSLAGESPPYSAVGAQLGMTEGAVKVAAHRLRTRYQEALRAEIAETVERPEDLDDEIRSLIAALD